MSKSFYKTFENVTYPCYWLGHDGELWLNKAAEEAEPFGDFVTVRRILEAAAREMAASNRSGGRNLPFLADALRLQGLSVLPVEGGILAACTVQGELPVTAFSSQLREPLTNVFAVLPLVAKKLDDPDAAYLEEIQDNCYSLLRLTQNLEDAGRLETRTPPMVLLDYPTLVNSLAFCVSTVCKERGVPVEVSIPEENIAVKGDSRFLSSAILNVLRNSIQYTRDGNTIRIKMVRAGSRVLLTIEDKGLGIKPEHLTHIFEPYFSMDPYGDGGLAPGLGLGLSLMQQTVRSFGGSVTAESTFGEGTRITIALPIADEPAGEAVLSSDPADYLLNRYSPVYVQLSGYCRLPGL